MLQELTTHYKLELIEPHTYITRYNSKFAPVLPSDAGGIRELVDRNGNVHALVIVVVIGIITAAVLIVTGALDEL